MAKRPVRVAPPACPYCGAAREALLRHCPDRQLACGWWRCDVCSAVMTPSRWYRVSMRKAPP